MKEIYFLTGHFATPRDTTSRILTKIACALASEHKVVAISGTDPDSETYDEVVTRDYGVTIERIPRSQTNNQMSLPVRLWHSARLSLTLIGRLRRNLKPDTEVVIVTNPELLMLTAAFLRRFRKFRLSIMVHDVFPENTLSAGIFKSEKHPLYRLARFIYNKAYASADRLIVLGRDMKEVIEKKVAGSRRAPKVVVIPNFPGTPSVIPDYSRECLPLKRLNQGKIKVVYAGNLGRVQGIPELFSAWVAQYNPNAELHFYGGGVMCQRIDRLIKESGRDDVFFHGRYEPSSQDSILEDADICVISLSPGMYGLGVPSKSYNTFAAGRPVVYIGAPGSEIWQVVEENQLGICVPDSDLQKATSYFSSLDPSMRPQLEEMGKRAARVCADNYSERIILNDYSNLFSDK